MNFYQLIKQQYNNYKINEECEFCPCKTLRNKLFDKQPREICSIEVADLILKYHITEHCVTFLCKDCRKISLIIAKKLFGKEGFNKI